jgi:hypothetical protein
MIVSLLRFGYTRLIVLFICALQTIHFLCSRPKTLKKCAKAHAIDTIAAFSPIT